MWSIKLTDSQRDALRLLIQAQGEVGPSLMGALESLELARWDDLPEAELPWDKVSELARAQGRLGRLTEHERRTVESVTAQIVNKLLHLPTVRMKEAAATADGAAYADAVEHLFGLEREQE